MAGDVATPRGAHIETHRAGRRPSRLYRLIAALASTEWAVALAVGGLALGLHAPFAADVPANWDSAQFALGVERFDLAAHQPHPPGYPLYIALARALSVITGDAHAALVLLSLAAGAAAPALLVILGRRWGGSLRGGAVAGLLFAVSPLAWYYGAVGLTYAVEAALGLAVVWRCWVVVSEGRGRSTVAAAGLLAVAGGVRPSTLLFLLPVVAFALAHVGWRARLKAVGVFAVGVAAWGLPLVAASGGLAEYLAASARLGAIAGNSSSVYARGPAALLDNAGFTAAAAGFGFNAVLALAPALLGRRWRPAVTPAHWMFVAVWVAPALMFFLTVHIGQAGYLLLIAPAAYLIAGGLLARLSGGSVVRLAGVTAALLAISVVAFLQSPNDLAAPYMDEHRRYWHAVKSAVTSEPATNTVVLTGERAWEGFRLAEHLLPTYDVRAVGDPLALGPNAAGPAGEVFRTRDHRSTYAAFLDGAAAAPVLRFDPPAATVFVLDESAGALLPTPDRCERLALTERRGALRCRYDPPVAELPLGRVP